MSSAFRFLAATFGALLGCLFLAGTAMALLWAVAVFWGVSSGTFARELAAYEAELDERKAIRERLDRKYQAREEARARGDALKAGAERKAVGVSGDAPEEDDDDD